MCSFKFYVTVCKKGLNYLEYPLFQLKETILYIFVLADAFIKSALSLIPEIQKQIDTQNSTTMSSFEAANPSKFFLTSMSAVEKFLSEYLTSMMSTLLLIPDNPEQGVLYLLTGVINLISKHVQWENEDIKFNLLANSMIALSAMSQTSFIYHLNNGKFVLPYSFTL